MSATCKERLLAKVHVDSNGCWRWAGSLYKNGYAQLWNGERPEQAHRISYRLFKGPIPQGKEIDHDQRVCPNRDCTNPEHLRAVSHRTNIRCSSAPMGLNARKTHCKRGHALSGANLRIVPSGARQCRKCVAMHSRNYREKKSAEA